MTDTEYKKELEKYLLQHIRRIIGRTNNFYKEEGSICTKCHETDDDINCLFCFCPFYYLDECGGEYKILESGIKDCSDCILRHKKEFIITFFEAVYENAETVMKWMQEKENQEKQ